MLYMLLILNVLCNVNKHMALNLLYRRLSTLFLRSDYVVRHTGSSSKPKKPILVEVGSVQPIRIGKYLAGQCFIHRTFAYRGVILCGWSAKVLDRDDKESPRNGPYYQVLVDSRDTPHIRVHTELGKITRNKRRTAFRFAVPGLDHVDHQDIIPYEPTELNPIEHGLFDKLFVVRPSTVKKTKNIVPKMQLHEWRRSYLPWLYSTQVHKMATENIRVTAMAFYMGRRRVTHWWRYNIRIENLSGKPTVLQGQRWGIYTGNGELQTVRGIGILGHLPVLSPEAPAMQYSSHVTLLAPRGHMWGYYLVQNQPNGKTFLCPVPSFSLESTALNLTEKGIT